ncbi:MAG: hypothetical protein AB8G22_27590 [Saprospiraceae bacterium]
MSRNITPSNYSYEDDRVSTFFALLLFLVSIGALYMVCANFSTQPSSSATSSNYQQPKQEQKSEFLLSRGTESISTTSAEPKLVNTASRSLSVNGFTEVGEQIRFTIEHFSPEAKYHIDFGDGRLHEVTQQDVIHSYRHPNTYHVKVQMEYAGQVKTISKKTLSIYPAIEMKASIAETEF